jgi:hypothetical protein
VDLLLWQALSSPGGPSVPRRAAQPRGKYVPFLVLVSLISPPRWQLGGPVSEGIILGRRLLTDVLRDSRPAEGPGHSEASERALAAGVIAAGITSVKLSPTANYVVLGYGVRDVPPPGDPAAAQAAAR